MALTVNDVYENWGSRFQLQAVAGTGGMNRPVQWVYVAEDYTTSDFLRGGELIITTGVISEGKPEWLLRFLQHMTEQNTCGLILNLGPYLQYRVLTEEVLAFCSSRDYPLFVMPWHIHIYDVTRVLYEQLYLHTRRDEVVQESFAALLSGVPADSETLRKLREAGWAAGGSYYTAALKSRKGNPPDDLPSALSPRCRIVKLADEIYVVAACDSTAALKELLGPILSDHPELAVGLGDRAAGLSGLYQSGRHALTALRLGLRRGESITEYDLCGLYRLLAEVPDPEILQRYADDYLRPVLNYDAAHGSSLTDTLRLYLQYNGSVQAVAAEAFIHRNTVNHRLRILKEELGLHLADPRVRFELMTAYQAADWLTSAENAVGTEKNLYNIDFSYPEN